MSNMRIPKSIRKPNTVKCDAEQAPHAFLVSVPYFALLKGRERREE